MIIANGSLVARGLDRSGEASISILEWVDAAAIAVKRIRVYHGDVRGDALEAHHRIVLGLATSVSWQVAVLYDIQQRGAMAGNPLHDVAPLDEKALAIASARVAAVTQQQAATAQSAAAHQSSPTKRSASSLPYERNTKRANTANSSSPAGGRTRCFRCGAAGHLPKECSAVVTRAGQPPAALSTDPRSPNGLCAPRWEHLLLPLCHQLLPPWGCLQLHPQLLHLREEPRSTVLLLRLILGRWPLL